MIHFSLTPDDKRCKIQLTYKLNKDVFEGYKNICEHLGVRYNRDHDCMVASLEEVPGLMAAFVANKYKCTLEEKLLNIIQQTADMLRIDMKEAEKRLRKMEKKLAKTGKQLWEYQRTGIMWMATRRRCLLADEMGLGKTVQACMALSANVGTVIVCPNVAKRVWYDHIASWRPDLSPYIFEGRGSFQFWPEPGQVFIINYDILPGAAPDNCPVGVQFISDESHALKNVKAKRTKHFRILKDAVVDARGKVWLLTGSPMLNRPNELWTVLESGDLGADAYGTWQNFLHLFKGTPSSWGYEWGQPDPEAAVLLKKVCLMRKRIDVLPDLPTKIYSDIPVDLNDKKLLGMLNDIVKDMEEAGLSLDDVSVEELQGNQIIFSKLSRVRSLLAQAKIPAMMEMVEQYEENEEPLVVFSAHRAPINVLAGRPGWAIITGDVSNNDRDQIIKDFQDGKYKGIGITIQSGGVGITLTHAAHALFIDLMWTPALNAQAEDRLCRIGQTRGVNIIRFTVRHIVEERVHYLLTQKGTIIDAGVNAAKTTEEDVVKLNIDTEILAKAKIGGPQTAVPTATAIERIAQTLAKNENIVVPLEERKPANHDAKNPLEQWTKKALVKLYTNSGFNRFDKVQGSDLAKRLINGGLTDAEWRVAMNMLNKYQQTVGTPPAQ